MKTVIPSAAARQAQQVSATYALMHMSQVDWRETGCTADGFWMLMAEDLGRTWAQKQAFALALGPEHGHQLRGECARLEAARARLSRDHGAAHAQELQIAARAGLMDGVHDVDGARRAADVLGFEGLFAVATAQGLPVETAAPADVLALAQACQGCTSPAVWRRLGQLLWTRLGRPIQATEALERALHLDPEQAESWLALGDLYRGARGDREAAEGCYRAAVEADPNCGAAWAGLAIVTGLDGDALSYATAAAHRALELEPDTATHLVVLALVLHRTGDRGGEAERVARSALDLAPKDPATWSTLGLVLEGNPATRGEAEAAYRQAVTLAPDDPTGWAALAGLLLRAGDRANDALDALQRVLSLTPSDALAWHDLGTLHLEQRGDIEGAQAAYTRALDLAPDLAPAWLHLGNLHRYHRGDPARAAACYREATRHDPNELEYRLRLGEALQLTAEGVDEAGAVFRAAVEFAPEDPEAANCLAWHLLRFAAEPDLVQAEALARRAADHPRAGANHWHTLAEAQLLRERHADAATALETCVQLADHTFWQEAEPELHRTLTEARTRGAAATLRVFAELPGDLDPVADRLRAAAGAKDHR